MSSSVLAVIPARLDSGRFPGKVLYSYREKPLLFYVWREACNSRLVDEVVVATDNREVRDAATKFGARVLMTSARIKTGSDRAAVVADRLGGRLIINIQADNFGLKASVVDRVVTRMLADRTIAVATLARRITSDDDLLDPDIVKVVLGSDGRAMWFSRYPLPYVRHAGDGPRTARHRFYEHIGVYFFRRSALARFAGIPRTPCEKAESLEQLRVLEAGDRMQVYRTSVRTVSVDKPEDVEKLSTIYQ
ncbi:MAG: 3-deoxy-manno-octulosonate cytidylyltransferase [Candidatus Zixiibacteriota bacterium]|nr:MAG: 3-deoxy-manno-octulosonate cytidylyltransferase [candidate division Zixibacteria bacterium]